MMSYFWNTATAHGSFELLTLLALAAAKATLLLTFAALLCFAFRRFSAATRHLVWASALCAALLLPFLSFIKMWEVPVLPARMLAFDAPGAQDLDGKVEASETRPAHVPSDASHVAGDLTRSSRAGAAARRGSEVRSGADVTQELLPATNPAAGARPGNEATVRTTPLLLPRLLKFALAVWLTGLLLVLCKLLAGFIATRLLTRRAAEFDEPELNALFTSLLAEINLKSKVRLLRSERTSMPVVCGILRPAVMLPAEADAWSEERRRMVLLHELTHVTRRDCLTQMMAQMTCAFYWFNPFIWFAARRLRVEREQACDDYVLSIGTKPSVYASHLLDIARSAHERPVFDWSQTTSVAMARRSQLEGRLLAILSKENKRGAVSRVALTGLLALTCVLLLTLAAVHPTVIHAQDSLNSDAAKSVEKDAAGRAAPGAFVAGDAGRGVEAWVQDGAARAASGIEPEDAPAAIDQPLEPISNEGRIEQEAGLTSMDEIERETEADVAEAPAVQSGTAQLPEVESAISLEANSFIKASHRQDGNAQAQSRPGDFIDEMASLGLANLSVDELIRLKTAGVTAAYVRSLRAAGFTDLAAKELVSMSIHGVTVAYIQTMRAAGYNALSAKELTTFRIHGITPDYIKNLRDAGYGNLDAKQLLRFSVHNVTPAFIGGMRAAGYGNLTPKELVSLRVYSVTPEFIRKARGRLGDLTIKQIISLKSMGILEEDQGKEKDKDKAKG